jgi:hypothetical protein
MRPGRRRDNQLRLGIVQLRPSKFSLASYPKKEVLLAALSLGALPDDARTEPRSGPVGQAEIQEAAFPSSESETLDRAHLAPRSGVVRPLADGGAAWLHDGSCMSREAHVQFCESLGVRFPGATHPEVGRFHSAVGLTILELAMGLSGPTTWASFSILKA